MYENFRVECARLKLTNKQIAIAAGVSENTASSIRNGKTRVTIEVAFKLRHAFFPELSLEYLFGAA